MKLTHVRLSSRARAAANMAELKKQDGDSKHTHTQMRLRYRRWAQMTTKMPQPSHPPPDPREKTSPCPVIVSVSGETRTETLIRPAPHVEQTQCRCSDQIGHPQGVVARHVVTHIKVLTPPLASYYISARLAFQSRFGSPVSCESGTACVSSQ